MNPALHLRDFVSADGEPCRQLFHETVRRVNSCDYSPSQVDAWAAASRDRESWLHRFANNFAYVAEHHGVIVGFADMTRSGYLDRLFVSADHQRQGIATMLMDAIESAAQQHGITLIQTHASITAKPFFRSRGFQVVTAQTVACQGVEMTNFVMELHDLGSRDDAKPSATRTALTQELIQERLHE
ncbi:GNAT family N-acetyltransferase [Allorhodopirellula heiligendammensis]|uniref:N-acetyltransferase YafP n=1 Tax=Allorhodopirellula heiligendammensis TaxID=2714739 RepID=A0A5C6CAT3_9BACT|nr:GNAT family N-acetyltransferase [Allorhodopirellula heiligendammensis]TWU19909.1 putative N-acetyltransferase YafP [Allorhodopirellula heiligendammensis]